MLHTRLAGWCGIAAGIGGFVYSLGFVVVARSAPDLGDGIAAAALLVVGLLLTGLLTGLYSRLREVDADFARWALLLGAVAALASAAHGGYDLANLLNPPGSTSPFPNEIDPRGLFTFGVSGLSVLIWAWLVSRDASLPRALAMVGYLNAALLLLIYLARLITASATNPIVVLPAVVDGFVVGPLWYLWIGRALMRPRA